MLIILVFAENMILVRLDLLIYVALVVVEEILLILQLSTANVSVMMTEHAGKDAGNALVIFLEVNLKVAMKWKSKKEMTMNWKRKKKLKMKWKSRLYQVSALKSVIHVPLK